MYTVHCTYWKALSPTELIYPKVFLTSVSLMYKILPGKKISLHARSLLLSGPLKFGNGKVINYKKLITNSQQI